LLKYPN